jgi:hypothetical protein
MEAYEGKTVRLKPGCPLCTGHMEPGFIPILNDSAMNVQSEWVVGKPHHRRWLGLKLKGTRRYAIEGLRCAACGYLALYATRPLNDVQ